MINKIKILKYLISNDKELLKWFLKRPFFNTFRYLLSLTKNTSPFFGVKNFLHFQKLLKNPNNLLFLGFSYCHKPKNCPSLFFSPLCNFDKNCQICQNCDIGKYKPHNPIIITTVNYLAKKLLEIKSQNPDRQILFIMSACPFSISLFNNFAKMLSIKGVALILEGKVCTSFQCFTLAEKGKKTSSTALSFAQKKLLDELLNDKK